MPAAALSSPIRGACPGVTDPLAAADGLLLRVRLPGGTIPARGLRAVAEVAERFGNATVELTARANVQIRGVRPPVARAAAERLVAAGLAEPDPGRDRRRAVVGSPLAGHDPSELVDLGAEIGRMARLLAAGDGLDGLPPKFGVVVDGGGAASVRWVPADVAVGVVRTAGGTPAVQVELGRSLDGGAGPLTCIPPDAAVAVVLSAARRCAAGGARMSALVERSGRVALVDEVLAGAGLGPPPTAAPTPRTLPPPTAAPPPGVPAPPLGRLAHPRAGHVNLGAAPLLGRTSPESLHRVAAAAESAGAGIRLTPWRGIVLAGVPQSRRVPLAAEVVAAGFSVDPDDPGHLVSACVGRPGCAWSRGDTARAARDLLDGPRPPTTRIHLAGCDKRCGTGAHPVAVAGPDGSFEVAPR